MGADLLSESPDLVVLEFSVNDFGTGDDSFCAYLLFSFIRNAINEREGRRFPFPPFRYSDLYQNAGILTQGDTAVTVALGGWSRVDKEKGRMGFASPESDP